MKTETFYESHPVKLTHDETNERAREGAEIAGKIKEKKREIETHKEDSKRKAKDLEAEEEALTARLFQLGEIVRSGHEPRQVECEQTENPSAATIDTHRLDTGEVVSSRAMSQSELRERQQTQLPGTGIAPQRNAKSKKTIPDPN